MNEKSSRSHAIFIITVEMSDTKGPLENRVRVGKLNLVDLAGSERQNKTNSEVRLNICHVYTRYNLVYSLYICVFFLIDTRDDGILNVA